MANKRNKKAKFKKREKPEFDQLIVDLARVTRVTKGGKQLSFRACVVIGNRRGKVGYGVEKGKDVQIAVEKAVNQAKKNLISVPFNSETIPHQVQSKYKAAKVMVKPAPQGSGIIAGSVIRTVLEMAGVPNASAKMLGRTNNKIVNVKATFLALQKFKKEAVEQIEKDKETEKKAKMELVKEINKKIETKKTTNSKTKTKNPKKKLIKKTVKKDTDKKADTKKTTKKNDKK